MKRIVCALLALFGATAFLASGAEARVRIHVDLSAQRMTVESSSGSYVWPVSTARSGYVTPRGSYAPTSLQRMHYSRKYHMSPMPHSIFFRGGYAIHGTYATSALGRPASHGCIRLAPAAAAALFAMVKNEGASISISGAPPASRAYAAAKAKHRHYAAARAKTGAHHYAAASHRNHRAAYYAGRYRDAPLAYAPGYRLQPRGPAAWQHDPYGFFWR